MIDIDVLLAWGATYKRYNPDDLIFEEGAHCRYYYQLVEGRLQWQNSNEKGKEFVHEIVEPGECFGEIPLFDDQPYAADAIAIKDSTVIRLSADIFKQLLKENPAIHFEFSKLLAERLRFKFMLLRTIACENPDSVVSTLLQYTKDTRHPACIQRRLIELTRQDIANMTGLRVETVIRSVIHLKEKGQLNIEHGRVYL
ncbi:MAG: Crp/Fnr family transcriptional regulator [Bacteroidetes bacterium]|nr:Crp/Fnr family transcriptional regulator [Bacteroidota bacterium]